MSKEEAYQAAAEALDAFGLYAVMVDTTGGKSAGVRRFHEELAQAAIDAALPYLNLATPEPPERRRQAAESPQRGGTDG